MQNGLRELLEKRRNRAMAVVLGYKEREVDPHLPGRVSSELRKKILEQFNDYHAFVADVLDSLDTSDGVVLNDFYLQRIDELHRGVERLVASLED